MNKQEQNFKISFQEMSLRNQEILSIQPEISYAQALKQIQHLKKISQATNHQRRADKGSSRIC
jgi:hypothetical protein